MVLPVKIFQILALLTACVPAVIFIFGVVVKTIIDGIVG